jgi:hypothetical protein
MARALTCVKECGPQNAGAALSKRCRITAGAPECLPKNQPRYAKIKTTGQKTFGHAPRSLAGKQARKSTVLPNQS